MGLSNVTMHFVLPDVKTDVHETSHVEPFGESAVFERRGGERVRELCFE